MNATKAVEVLKTGKRVTSGHRLHIMCHGDVVMTTMPETSCAGAIQSVMSVKAFVDQNKQIKFYEQ